MVVSVDEARAIAKEAYIYGFPLVDSYRIQYSYFVNREDPEYKGSWNEIHNTARVYTPDDKTIQTPNSDTPYSTLGADLRAEPLILTMPAIEKGRYYSAQFVDAYTFNFDYLGTRTSGNEGGTFMLAGPGWKGEKPRGIKAVLESETQLALVIYRTQLFNAVDIENVNRIQEGYRAQTLSQFLGKPAPPEPPKIDFPKPISADEERTSLEFFNLLNFVLQFCPTHPSEKDLMRRFGKLGIGAGKRFGAQSLAPDLRRAIVVGMAEAWQECGGVDKRMARGELTSADLFGTRSYLQNNYLYRMVAAANGIYGNSKEEAFYPGYIIDSDGQVLDGSASRYSLRFAPGELPPVNAFWSLTVYSLSSRLLVPNALNRYLINSAMLPGLKRDTDDGITLHIQRETPGEERESNWLPAPNGSFVIVLRLYWPRPEAFGHKWKQPAVLRLEAEGASAEMKKAG